MNILLVVIGMHRSGTSCVTGCISRLGVYPGHNGQLLHPSKHNPKGYYENFFIMTSNDDICKEFLGGWFTTLSLPEDFMDNDITKKSKEMITHIIRDYLMIFPISVLKEPRISLLLPLYLEIFRELQLDVRFVVVNRNERDNVQSISKSHNKPPHQCLTVRNHYLKSIADNTRWFRKASIQYEELLSDPFETLRKLGKDLGIKWPIDVDDVRARYQIADFIDNSLCHYRS
jgi:hypothetical protein